MSQPDEEISRKNAGHEIGCDLTFLSADELQRRIDLMKAEIGRLEQEISRKTAGRAAAENLFRKNPD